MPAILHKPASAGTIMGMLNLLNVSIGLLALGIFTSVTVLGAHQILFAIPVGYFTWLSFKEKKFKLSLSGWFLLIFAIVSLASCIINHEDLARVSKNYGKIKYDLIAVFSPFALFYFLQHSSQKTKKILFHLFLSSMIVAAVYGMIEMFVIDKTTRINGLTNTMRYGYGLSMCLVFLLGLIMRPTEAKKYVSFPILLTAFVISVVAFYLTFTRGAMAGFLVGAPLALFLWGRKIGLVLGLGFIGVLLFISINYFTGEVKSKNRFLSNQSNKSDQIRKSQWQSAVIAIKERPLFGWGPSNFHSQVKRIKEENNLGAQQYVDHHSHNLFLETAAGTGLVGLFFFVGWLLLWLKEVSQGPKLWCYLMLPFFVTAAVGAQFEVISDANNNSMIYFLYGLSMAINMMTHKNAIK